MPFEIPKYFNAETRSMIEVALDEAWHELSKGTRVEATSTKRRLVRTMVALAAVGETDLIRHPCLARIVAGRENDDRTTESNWQDSGVAR